MNGILHLVATPIGNLEDITLRAISILKSVDLIACEDTRRTGKLLKHLDIKKPLISYYEHNEDQRVPALIEKLKTGTSIALVTDSGTPLIADPGFPLVRVCLQENISVTSIPGPSAILPALQLSGLPTHQFLFLGFLPKRPGNRKNILEWIKEILEHKKISIILYAPPHRIDQTLAEIVGVVGNRPIALCRELTKIHEEVLRGTVAEIRQELQEHPRKGEMVLVVA